MRARLHVGCRVAGAVLVPLAAAVVLASGVAGAAAPTLAAQTVNQFQKNGGVFPGYRRNHAQGVCISGYFQSSGAAARYSVAEVFQPGERTPVVGRFSIPGTNPYAWDDVTPIRGMALDFLQADGREWRTAMNAVPAFPVATPAANLTFLEAQQPDPATGNPDPAKLAAFFKTHPRADAFRRWDRSARPSTSYATVGYNSLDAFYFIDARGGRHAVRWSMMPTVAADGSKVPPGTPDFLAADLHHRLAQGPLRWHLVVTLAAPGDAIDDATVAWPANRQHVDAGTLVIEAAHAQATGVCRDIGFDPLILPAGIQPSADPLLKARADAYAESLRRRLRDETTADAPGG
ncbi:MAG: catalase family peroxidase [Rhodanobacteraceae bacterium]|nr:MAG: catalase family peroxidase [Rhodanobacteraceae bacterium]